MFSFAQGIAPISPVKKSLTLGNDKLVAKRVKFLKILDKV
jgi:hypothetical protein